jgi:hypothetical protein
VLVLAGNNIVSAQQADRLARHLEEVKARRRQSFYEALERFDDEEVDQLLSLLEALPLAFSGEEETSDKRG